MQKTLFHISQMDCPSEENLIRMQLGDSEQIRHLDFDLQQRQLTVFHEGNAEAIEAALRSLDLGAQKIKSEASQQRVFAPQQQRGVLWRVLGINFAFFLIEATTGLLSDSMGLVADSLDMLADSLVYGLSLLAVGGSMARKKSIARMAGYLQLGLALLGFMEVLRRFFGTASLPDFFTMALVAFLALLANALCLYLLQGAKDKEEAHLQASLIFTSNDIIINLGVIAAAGLVYTFDSNLPDLLVGSLVFVLVMRGALRILKLGK